MPLQPFHLAVPVSDLKATRQFYGEFLGFEEGRSTDGWIDWNFFGHQFVTHLNPNKKSGPDVVNPVDGHGVPVPHFGVVLEWNEWHKFAEKLKAANIKFVIEPYIRFRGAVGEQATMFFLDPSGNALEFKAFKDESQLFAKYK
jgi:extradiol dioxygenase family protein